MKSCPPIDLKNTPRKRLEASRTHPERIPKDVTALKRERAKSKRRQELKQRQLLDDNSQFHETIRSKLDGHLDTKQFINFSKCGHEAIYRTCGNCQEVKKLAYPCNIKWCPRCSWRIADNRRKLITQWASHIRQPKHLILTQKNSATLTKDHFKEHTANLVKLRRRESFALVRGGCVSVETTKEDNDWHVHSHWLIDTDWVDIKAVSADWASLVGQDFAICKVKDVRQAEYLHEVCKYVVEGSELAKWSAADILTFVTAIKGQRFFFPFGSLKKMSWLIKAELAASKPPPKSCDCGNCDFHYADEARSKSFRRDLLVTKMAEHRARDRRIEREMPLIERGVL